MKIAKAQSTTITLSPNPGVIQGCESLQVGIWINDVENLYGADVRLSFDPDVLQVVDVDSEEEGVQIEHGGFLEFGWSPFTEHADNDLGTIQYAITQFNPSLPVTGTGVLAIITFQAKSEGFSTLEFTDAWLSDKNGSPLTATTEDGLISTTIAPGPKLSIEKLNSSDLRLSWVPVGGEEAFNIYRDAAPYFTPGTVYHSTIQVSFDDISALGDSATNYYYVVKGVCSTGFESAESSMVGEFDFSIVEGDAGDAFFNVISLPLDATTEIPDASGISAEVGSSLEQSLTWHKGSQAFEFWIPEISFGTNFSTTLAHVYWIQVNETAPGMFSIVGDVPASGSVRFDLVGSAVQCLWNEISLPLDQSDLSSASDLANDIGGVDRVSQWDSDSQGFLVWDHSLGTGIDFSLRIGYPYHVCLNATAPPIWP